jgi:hypothetical protein
MSGPLAQRAIHMYVGYSELIVTAPGKRVIGKVARCAMYYCPRIFLLHSSLSELKEKRGTTAWLQLRRRWLKLH